MKKQSKEDLSIFPRVALIELIDYLQKALEYKQDIIDKAIDFIKNNIVATETEEILLDILKGEE